MLILMEYFFSGVDKSFNSVLQSQFLVVLICNKCVSLGSVLCIKWKLMYIFFYIYNYYFHEQEWSWYTWYIYFLIVLFLSVTPLVYRAVTRVIHPFRSLPSFWSVSQLLFCTFILVFTICRQVTSGLPLLRFPAGAQHCFLNTVQFPSKYIAKPIPTSSEHSWGHVLLQTTVEKALILDGIGPT